MNPVDNPYTPNAGARPQALVGRDELLDDFRTLVGRIQRGSTDKGLLITGLRGVGKTVLLNEFRQIASSDSTVVRLMEVSKFGEGFAGQLANNCKSALYAISPRDKWRAKAEFAARVITSFSATFDPDGRVRVGVDLGSQDGVGVSGSMVSDLPEMILALGEAARDHGKSVVILLDEIQYLKPEELGAVIMAKHQINQNSLPIVFSGAGLPLLPKLTGDVQTYSERMFTFPKIGSLDMTLAKLALTAPAAEMNVFYTDEAADYVCSYTEGYPYFIQEFGKAAWNQAESSPITLEDVQAARALVEQTLDRDFYAVGVTKFAEREQKYLKALAGLGSGEHSQAQIATAMGLANSNESGSVVTRLIEKGLIYKTRRGVVAFVIPQFGQYVLRSLSPND